jgi:ribokinase
MGARCGPRAGDSLPWSELDATDAVYLTAGDPDAVRAARQARRLVATVRAIESLAPAHVEIDALVASARDEGERYRPGDLDPPPRLVARTDGAAGGTLTTADGTSTPWEPVPLPGPAVDAYGAGDCFAAGFTYALADGRTSGDAVAFGARCGAACMAGRGPYEGQLRTPL